jgi:hypothetical protein
MVMQAKLTQSDVITFYGLLRSEAKLCENPTFQAHLQHSLLSLQKIIESFGPTLEYREWLRQTGPTDLTEQYTFVIDL